MSSTNAKVIDARFQETVKIIGSLPKEGAVQPSDTDKLTFYGLFKQANVGDNDTTKPGLFDFVGKAKWTAWDKVKGKSAEDAKKEYVEAFIAVLAKNPGPESDAFIKQIDDAGAAAETTAA